MRARWIRVRWIFATFLAVSLLAPRASRAQEEGLALVLEYAGDAKTALGYLTAIKSASDFLGWLSQLGSSSGPTLAQIETDIYTVGLSLSYQIRDQSIASPLSTISGAHEAALACIRGWNGQGTFKCPDVARQPDGSHSTRVTDMVAAVLQLEDPVYQYRLFVESATNGAWKGIVKSRPQTTQMNLSSPLYGGTQVFDWRRVVPTLMEAYRHELEVAAISDSNYACDPYWYAEVIPDHIARLTALRDMMLAGIKCNLVWDYKQCPKNPYNSGSSPSCPTTDGSPWPYGSVVTDPPFGVRFKMVCADMFTGVASDVLTSPYCQLTRSALGPPPELCSMGGCGLNGYPPWYSPYICSGYSNNCTDSTSYLPDNPNFSNCSLNTGLCCSSSNWCGNSGTGKYLSSSCGPIMGPAVAAVNANSLKGQLLAKTPLASMQGAIDAMQAIVDYGCPSQAGWNQGRVFGTTQRYPVDFNVVAFQYATSIQHIAGPLAAGGAVHLSGFSLNPDFTAGYPVGLVGGGEVILSSGTVGGNIDVVAGQTVSIPQTVTQSGGVHTFIASPIDFGDLQSKMIALSDKLKTLPSTAPALSYSTLTFTVSNPVSNVFSVSASTLSSVYTIQFVLSNPAYVTSTVIINVTGDPVTIQNLGFTRNGIDATKLLWNFADATSLTMQSIAFPGSALAPRANAEVKWGFLDGTIVANSVTGYNEYHRFPFGGNLRVLLQ